MEKDYSGVPVAIRYMIIELDEQYDNIKAMAEQYMQYEIQRNDAKKPEEILFCQNQMSDICTEMNKALNKVKGEVKMMKIYSQM